MSAGEVADWDAEAEGYDEPADHGLRDPSVRAAWRALLLGVLPQPPAASRRCEEGAYDAVLARHVLWALPDPADALARWLGLLGPGGTLVLVEGHWSTGAA